MIAFEHVGVRVPRPGAADKVLLTDIDVRLDERRVAVIGPNGSGKSTLLRLINGLVEATSGRVVVDGLDVARQGKQVRRTVGFTFADALSQLVMVTPVEDIELSLRHAIPNRAERRERALAILRDRGLERVAHQSIYELSGGERQLVALLSVLAVDRTIMVCDEPTTLLDLRHRNRMAATLLELPQQLIFATHDLDFAARADRALLVVDGRIAADGVPAEVIDGYRELARA